MATLPSPTTFPSGSTFPSASELIPGAASQLIHVREKPPLRQSIIATTPSGRRYRWAEDEPRAENVFGDLRYSDSMPGGYERMSCSLPRKGCDSCSDLERLTTLNIYGAGGERDGEFRLEEAPAESGDRMVISPAAVGWVANLDDDKSARELIIDRDMSRWRESGRQRQLGFSMSKFASWSLEPDSTGLPALAVKWSEIQAGLSRLMEVWYDAGGVDIGQVFWEFDNVRGVGSPDANWHFQMATSLSPDVHSGGEASADHDGVDAGTTSLTAGGPGRKALFLYNDYAGAFAGNLDAEVHWKNIAVVGHHGLPLVGGGFLASDVVRHVVQKWAPLLKIGPASITPSSYAILHLAPIDMTTGAEIVRQASRFELPYWGVWDDREFVWDPNRTPRKRWHARSGPAQLKQTGQSVQRVWESIVVQYQDVDGSTRTAGPPGSGADVEDALLKDPDPENPANKLGMVKRDLLVIGTDTPSGAIQVGRVFLEESKLLDTSGSATLVGYVQDDRGVFYPYTRVRSGDLIGFTDAADTSYRRIVHSEKVRAERGCHIDLDAPPQGLEQLLERLDAELVPLGL